jgi:hypothetical protein
MNARILPLILVLWPLSATAQDWRTLSGDEIAAALTDRSLAYDDGTRQGFFADGRTLYTGTSGESWGRWRVDGDRYCSSWPPAESWACYGVEANGIDLAFVAADGARSEGRYANPD